MTLRDLITEKPFKKYRQDHWTHGAFVRVEYKGLTQAFCSHSDGSECSYDLDDESEDWQLFDERRDDEVEELHAFIALRSTDRNDSPVTIGGVYFFPASAYVSDTYFRRAEWLDEPEAA